VISVSFRDITEAASYPRNVRLVTVICLLKLHVLVSIFYKVYLLTIK